VQIGLSPAKGLDVAELALDLHDLTNARVYRTIRSRKIDAGGSEYVIVEYDDGDLASPNSDPLVIGLLLRDGDYVPHAVWNNRIWSILTKESLSLLSVMIGITVEDLQTAEKVLNESQGQRTHSRHQQTTAGGPPSDHSS